MKALSAFSQLPWERHFTEALPGDPEKQNFTRRVAHCCYSETVPTPVRAPQLIGWSETLAQELGIARPGADLSLQLLAGNEVLPNMRPYAARYGGHQFGNWAGQLGDGRAISLGEAKSPDGKRFEFQLKGAGPTPYSRRADGRAVLRSSVREFLCSEAMHFLGVPTTRALSLVATGDTVIRDLFYDGNPKPEPGAIVCRVSPSFLRFGNFEILSSSQEYDLLNRLTQFLIRDHYSGLDLPEVLDAICRRTAILMVHWMRVGFVHGVMNTDNMSVLGLTIDYGPYGWLEPFDPHWTPNTTDAEGRRYCFGNQPQIALWNLARLAEAWYPLIPDENRLQESLNHFRTTFETTHQKTFAEKLGFLSGTPDTESLLNRLFKLMFEFEMDYTLFFRNLSEWQVSSSESASEQFLKRLAPASYLPEKVSQSLAPWTQWLDTYQGHLAREGRSDAERSVSMKNINPKYVLRNYLAQNAIVSAEQGDPSGIERLLRVLQRPYDDQPGEDDLAVLRPEWAKSAPGCSALSCSS